VATATGEAEEDEEEDWAAGTAKVRETLLRVILCPKRRKWWSRQTNFEDFSKDCQKKRSSKEFNFAVKSGTRKRTQRDTLRAARNTQIQYTHE
jgi:hypothetical protein